MVLQDIGNNPDCAWQMSLHTYYAVIPGGLRLLNFSADRLGIAGEKTRIYGVPAQIDMP